MVKVMLVLSLLSSIITTVSGQMNEIGKSSTADIRQELFQLRRTFFDAQEQGNRAVLEHLLADSFYFVHSTGVLTQKKEFVDRTVAQAARRPTIEFLEDQLFIYGEKTAVWLTRSISRSSEGVETNFRATDVLVKNGKQWQWVSVHSTKLPIRPRAYPVSSDTLAMYVGRYQIDDGKNLTITFDSDTLIGQTPGIRQRELIPTSPKEFVWFSPDSNVDMRIAFLKDDSGRVTHAVLRSEGVEVWRAKRIN